MTAVTAFDPRAFNLYAFQCDPFGGRRGGGSQGAKTKRREWLKLQWEIDEHNRLEREKRAVEKEREDAKAAEMAPILAEASRLVEELHREKVEPSIENAGRLLDYLTKPFVVVAPVKEAKNLETPRRSIKGLDDLLAGSPTLGGVLGMADVEIEAGMKIPTPEELAEVVDALEAFVGDDE